MYQLRWFLGAMVCAVALMSCQQAARESCSPDALANSRLLAAQTLQRSHGKPVVNNITFQTNDAESMCIVIKTGAENAQGDITAPAPASVTATLDDTINIAGPSDFNAKPTKLARRVSGALIRGGNHSLQVETRGRAGSHPGEVFVAILSFSPSDTSPPNLTTWDRLEHPTYLPMPTVVKDESIVTAPGLDVAQLTATLRTLPFDTMVIGSLLPTPIFQVLLPGTDGGAVLRDKVAAINAALTTGQAGLHYVGGFIPNRLPAAGEDRDYIDDPVFGRPRISDAAWHLTAIHAEAAWDRGTGNSNPKIGVIDVGLNIHHPDLENNIKGCVLPGSTGIESCDVVANSWVQDDWPACMQLDAGQEEAGQACAESRACFGEFPSWHGDAVAGLIAAEGGTIQGSEGDTVGVMWNAGLYLSSPTPFMDPFDDLKVINTMARNGVRVANISLGATYQCRDGSTAAHSDEKAGMTEQIRVQWTEMLRHHPTLLVVQSAGDSGASCSACTRSGKSEEECPACQASENGHACSVLGTPAEEQVLCVVASSRDGRIYAGATPHGTPLAAPGDNVKVLTKGAGTTQGWGSSFAAPLVTGAAGLMLSINEDLSPGQIRDILLSSGATAHYQNQDYRILDLDAATRQAARCVSGAYSPPSPTGDYCPQFNDVSPGSWIGASIHRLACDCVIRGYSDGTFRPDQDTNRVEFLKIALELAFAGTDFPAPTVDPYADVDRTAWYAKYAAFAKSHGIIDATDADNRNLFHPGDSITRAEAMKILVESAMQSAIPSFANLADAYAAIQSGATTGRTYSDVPLGSWFHDYVYAATAQCIVAGYPDGRFDPAGHLKRAEAAKVGCVAMHGPAECSEAQDTCIPWVN